MTTATPKRTRTIAVQQNTIVHAMSFLNELPQKPKEELSLREAVKRMQETIQAALAKGYNYPEIAKMLTDKGMKISAATLKNYVPSGRRAAAAAAAAAATKVKPRKARKSSTEELTALTSIAADLTVSPSPEEPAVAIVSHKPAATKVAPKKAAPKKAAPKKAAPEKVETKVETKVEPAPAKLPRRRTKTTPISVSKTSETTSHSKTPRTATKKSTTSTAAAKKPATRRRKQTGA